jgi:hypothetical protein
LVIGQTVLVNANVVELDCQNRRYRRDVISRNICSIGSVSLGEQSEITFKGEKSEWITSLYFYTSVFDMLPGKLFQVFPELKHVDLFRCELNVKDGHLDANFLKEMAPLEDLSLSLNSIKSMSEDSLKQLGNLERLSLTNNELTSLPENVFNQNLNLLRLELNDNKLTELPANLFKFNVKLETINLRNNQLGKLDANLFKTLSNLGSIYLSGNQLESLPATAFENNLKLNTIDLDNNKIKMISEETFNNLNKLQRLYLYDNVCISQQFGLGTDISKAESQLQPCYNNWKSN